jgi:hypothetical protein
MPAAIAIPLALGAGTAAAGVIGAKIQSNGASNAAKTQANAAQQAGAYSQNATNQALNYIQQQQQGMRQAPTYTGVTPFGGGASGAYNTMSRMLGGQGQAPMSPPSYGGSNLPMAPQGQPSYGGVFGQPQGGTVLMQAPNGQQKAIPAEQVAHYEQQGARRI